MDYRTFEQKLLDTIFTTDVPLNPATIAFLYKLTVQQASDLLQQAAVNGLLNIESDEEGNLLYTYPNRVRLPRDGKIDPRRADAAGQNKPVQVALVPTPSAALAPTPPAPTALPDSIDLLEASAPREDSKAGAATSLPPVTASAQPSAAREASGGSMRCPFCSEVILVGAKKCKHCHEYLDYALRDIHAQRNAVNQASSALVPQLRYTSRLGTCCSSAQCASRSSSRGRKPSTLPRSRKKRSVSLVCRAAACSISTITHRLPSTSSRVSGAVFSSTFTRPARYST